MPSRLARADEYRTLVRELSALDAGFVQLLAPDFDEQALVEIARLSGLGVCINAIFQRFGRPEAWRDDLERLARRREESVRFFGQAHCQPHDFEVSLRSTDVFDRWPTWRETLALDHDEKCRRLRDPRVRARMREEMDGERDSIVPLGWERILLVESKTGRHRAEEGRTLDGVARARSADPLDVMLDIALDEDLDSHFRVLDSRNQDSAAMLEILRSPYVIPGPSDAGAHLLRAANTGFPTALLGHWVREEQALGLEYAVHLLSGRAARELGIRDRGLLAEGQAADVVLFDPESIASLDRAFVRDLPGGGGRWIQHAGGIESVWVNGELTLDRGEPTGRLGGRTLRGVAE